MMKHHEIYCNKGSVPMNSHLFAAELMHCGDLTKLSSCYLFFAEASANDWVKNIVYLMEISFSLIAFICHNRGSFRHCIDLVLTYRTCNTLFIYMVPALVDLELCRNYVVIE